MPKLVGDSAGRTILMFSGGRDSTLAATRLAGLGQSLSLVTISSTHLVGFDRVRRRLAELASILPGETEWLRVRQPVEMAVDTSFYERTCLPCHHAYVVASAILADTYASKRLAFGYVGYQADWPEQTREAISSLRGVLSDLGTELLLPVYDIDSREVAVSELSNLGLSVDALEQKCLRQVMNSKLAPEKLTEQIRLWEHAMRSSLEKRGSIRIDVIEAGKLSDFA